MEIQMSNKRPLEDKKINEAHKLGGEKPVEEKGHSGGHKKPEEPRGETLEHKIHMINHDAEEKKEQELVKELRSNWQKIVDAEHQGRSSILERFVSENPSSRGR